MNQTQTESPTSSVAAQAAAFTLEPPAPQALVTQEQAKGLVPMDPKKTEEVKLQADAFVDKLLTQDLQSDEFRASTQGAFALGRAHIASCMTLSNQFTKRNFVGETDTPAFKAMSDLSSLFNELDPRKHDLLGTVKVLGISIPSKIAGIPVPGANKLASYMRRYESAEAQISGILESLGAAKLEISRDANELTSVQRSLWEGLQKLEAVVSFIVHAQNKLQSVIDGLQASDPFRAKALNEEVMFYLNQNLGDVRSAQLLAINAYNMAGASRKTANSVMLGCDRVATLGASALSIAVSMARATSGQVRTMQALQGASQTVEQLMSATTDAFGKHVDATIEFESNPLLGIEVLKKAMAETDAAVKKLEDYRVKSQEVQKANNTALAQLVQPALAKLSATQQVSASNKPILEL